MSEFLMLAKNYVPERHKIAGWFASEKLDGIRAFWDGGVSRGRVVGEIPWANDSGSKVTGVASGLWSRYGNVIHAPDWWLALLPSGVLLDGELWSHYSQWSEITSIVKRHTPDDRWRCIKYMIFESPAPDKIFMSREIKNPNFQKYINRESCVSLLGKGGDVLGGVNARLVFERLGGYGLLNLEQERLPPMEGAARERLVEKQVEILDHGGEGLILRHPDSIWVPQRTSDLLKVKPLLDAEGVVVGTVEGKGKYIGMIGSLTIEMDSGKRFQLSGMSDSLREPGAWEVERDRLVFKYRELSPDGIPKEARFWRRVNCDN